MLEVHFLKCSNIIYNDRQCSGTMTFCGGSGSGSADLCNWLMDSDPAISLIDLQDAKKRVIFKNPFSKIKKAKRCHKTLEIKVFPTIFALWEKYPDPYLWLNGSGSCRPKDRWIQIRIRISNTDGRHKIRTLHRSNHKVCGRWATKVISLLRDRIKTTQINSHPNCTEPD